jgi:hypothetical protein
MLYLLNYYYLGYLYYLAIGTKNPSTISSDIYSCIIYLILLLETAFDDKNCFFGSVRPDLWLVNEPSHFQPKLVSWFPAYTNISGVNNPFCSKSSGLTVNLDSTNFVTP